MQVKLLKMSDPLVSGSTYIFRFGSKKYGGIHKPGKGNEIQYPTFSVNGQLFSVDRQHVSAEVVGNG